jgi:N-succinyldiaminopimelate aminotransferase
MMAKTAGLPMLSKRVSSIGITIFSEMSALAREHGAINLGQGFPDFDGPDFVRDAAEQAMRSGYNQYALGVGELPLRSAISAHAARFYGQTLNPDTEVTVTCGATEALFAAMLGLLNAGDEVILFDPCYDSYVAALTFVDGSPRFVPLRAPEWSFDAAELAAAFNARTRMIVVNTPHNPTGHVFSRAELETIAGLCRKWNVIALVDEVYEHLVFDGFMHTRLAALPGMAKRTVTASSFAKTFSFTGWKVGWAVAPPDLSVGIRRAHQYITFAAATPLQHAAAAALNMADEYYRQLAADYQRKRDFLSGVLEEAGYPVTLSGGTYFVMADIRSSGIEDDDQFCRWLIRERGVAAIPSSALYSSHNKSLGRGWARFAFCKKDETLQMAAERLLK